MNQNRIVQEHLQRICHLQSWQFNFKRKGTEKEWKMCGVIHDSDKLICTGVRILAVPITESPPSIDMNGVKGDLDKKKKKKKKKHLCIPCYLTHSSMGARTLNFGESILYFFYTGGQR